MISKEVASKVLEKCLVTGGDFAEIFEEDTITNSIGLIDEKIENALGGRNYGVGIRIFKGFKSIYAYTNDNSLNSLLDTAYKAALALGNLKEDISVVLNETKIITDINPIKLYPSEVGYDKKIGIMKTAYKSAKDYSTDISQVSVSYSDKDQKVLIANTEDLYVEDCYASADEKNRIGIRVVTENAWHNLFSRNMFRRYESEEQLAKHKTDFTIIQMPNFHADRDVDCTNSEVFVLLKGKFTLYIGEGGDTVENVYAKNLEALKMYNVKKSTWHTHSLSEDAVVLIIENQNTQLSNSPEIQLSLEQRIRIVELSKG